MTDFPWISAYIPFILSLVADRKVRKGDKRREGRRNQDIQETLPRYLFLPILFSFLHSFSIENKGVRRRKERRVGKKKVRMRNKIDCHFSAFLLPRMPPVLVVLRLMYKIQNQRVGCQEGKEKLRRNWRRKGT